jgi:elongation factor Ts
MAEVTAQLVKELREITGAGMMDCKRALQETGGDIEAGIDWLKTKGISKAANKADRVAAEGAVAVAVRDEGTGMTAAVIELNAETDFVARNDTFQEAARTIAKTALDVEGDAKSLRAAKTANGETVDELVTNLIATVGENMQVRRAARLSVGSGVVGWYVHPTGDIGRIGVLVALESAGDKSVLRDVGRKISQHIANTKPLALTTDELDPAVVARERAIFTEQAAASGKPANVVEKMVEGRLRKFYEEWVLLKQTFVVNNEQTIEQVVAETAKTVGAPVTIKGFARLTLGEGVEKAAAG